MSHGQFRQDSRNHVDKNQEAPLRQVKPQRTRIALPAVPGSVAGVMALMQRGLAATRFWLSPHSAGGCAMAGLTALN
jgi:hypothetical protein